MRKTAPKMVFGDDHVPLPASIIHKRKSVDDLLADHLKEAEDHLIAALELFSGDPKPNRRVEYQTRLEGAQEAITYLYREELVRIRGPQRPRRSRKK